MYLKYGSFSHVQNDPTVEIHSRTNMSPRGFIASITYQWNIRGILQGADSTAILAAMVALEAAYVNNNGQDLILYYDDQATIAHRLLNAGSLGGTRIVSGPDYPVGDGAELGTFRTYEITVEADYPNVQQNIIAWDDSLTLEGLGGPRYVFLECLEGVPQQQIVRQQTTYRAQQAGRAVGLFAYVNAAPPVFPGALLPEAAKVTRRAPQRRLNSFTEFVTEWSYEFESTSPLNGLPIVA